jgi:adenosylcobinamide-GDP ribazoletransferase
MAWYPVVGVVIGGALSLADLLLVKVFAAEVVNGLLILLLVLLTRGLHQDGLADTLDGLAGGRTPTERLPIMRDPRIGAIGATGLVLSLILRYAGLLALPHGLRVPVLLCMPAVGRWAMVTLAWASPYARPDGGLAAPFVARLSWRQVLAATVALAAVLGGTLGLQNGLVVLVGGSAIVVMLWGGCRVWFGGITGDILGATNEVIEIVFLLFSPAVLTLS